MLQGTLVKLPAAVRRGADEADRGQRDEAAESYYVVTGVRFRGKADISSARILLP